MRYKHAYTVRVGYIIALLCMQQPSSICTRRCGSDRVVTAALGISESVDQNELDNDRQTVANYRKKRKNKGQRAIEKIRNAQMIGFLGYW
jgi:hypothetical protein